MEGSYQESPGGICADVWAQLVRKCPARRDALSKVQRRAARMVKGVEWLPYKEQLTRLRLFGFQNCEWHGKDGQR